MRRITVLALSLALVLAAAGPVAARADRAGGDTTITADDARLLQRVEEGAEGLRAP